MESVPGSGALATAKNSASIQKFPPSATIKCEGAPVFRSRTARDLACLLDLNPSVVSWTCMPVAIEVGAVIHVCDFGMIDVDSVYWLLDAPDRHGEFDIESHIDAAARVNGRYRLVSRDEVYEGCRLRNARDLLRYGRHEVALGDRVRLLSVLDENGPLPLSDCLTVIRETQPVAAVAAMILNGFVEVDLDEAILGPETMVRRIGR